MRYCKKCKVTVSVPRNQCPLCQNQIISDGKPETDTETFPRVPLVHHKYGLALRILMFISFVAITVCVTVNALLPFRSFWSLIVILGVVGMWLSIYTAIRKRRNVSKNLLWQAVLVSALVVAIDWSSGWHKWSINYVVPSVFVFTLLSNSIILLIMHRRVYDFIIYLVVDGLLGLIPLLFIITGWANVIWPSLVCVLLSLTLLAAILIFVRNMDYELKKRLHF